MSTPVHYDIETALANFREASKKREGQVLASPKATQRAKVQLRHREIAVGFLRLSLEEANRGTDTTDVLAGAVDIVAEFLVNYLQIYDEADQAHVLRVVCANLHQVTSMGLAMDVATLPFAATPKTRGGHA